MFGYGQNIMIAGTFLDIMLVNTIGTSRERKSSIMLVEHLKLSVSPTKVPGPANLVVRQRRRQCEPHQVGVLREKDVRPVSDESVKKKRLAVAARKAKQLVKKRKFIGQIINLLKFYWSNLKFCLYSGFFFFYCCCTWHIYQILIDYQFFIHFVWKCYMAQPLSFVYFCRLFSDLLMI